MATGLMAVVLMTGSLGLPGLNQNAPALPIDVDADTGKPTKGIGNLVNHLTTETLLAGAVKPIQPGALLDFGSLYCTQNLIFSGGGNLYIGTAAHCVSSVGQLARDENGAVIGPVVAFGNVANEATDWALIRINAARVSAGDVATNVRGWPGYPSGILTASEGGLGTPVLANGYGLGFEVCDCTRENRAGVITYQDTQIFECIPCLTINGDSGSALFDLNTGEAIGIVSRGLGYQIAFGTNFGPTFEGVLPQMAAAGFPVNIVLG